MDNRNHSNNELTNKTEGKMMELLILVGCIVAGVQIAKAFGIHVY